VDLLLIGLATLNHHEHGLAAELAHGADGFDLLADDAPLLLSDSNVLLLVILAVEQFLKLIILF